MYPGRVLVEVHFEHKNSRDRDAIFILIIIRDQKQILWSSGDHGVGLLIENEAEMYLYNNRECC